MGLEFIFGMTYILQRSNLKNLPINIDNIIFKVGIMINVYSSRGKKSCKDQLWWIHADIKKMRLDHSIKLFHG